MHCHPRWQWLIANVTTYTVKFYMGHYKSCSPKLTVLFSNSETILSQFKVGRPPAAKESLCRSYIDSSGKKRCVGKTQLKSSQKYPRAFGRKMSENLKKYRELVSSNTSSIQERFFVSPLYC